MTSGFNIRTRSVTSPGAPAASNTARFSMPMFLHPRPEVVLRSGTKTADYLNERLRETGLKS
jgi:hypothetical protein